MRIFREIANFDVADWFMFCLFGLPLIFALSFGAVAAVNAAASDGRGDYCFVRFSNGTYDVEQHVPWRDNRLIGYFMSPTDAQDFKQAVCGE